MAQHDYVIANDTGANFRADINLLALAIASLNAGLTEPSTTYAYQFWADTTTGLLKQRNAANSAWVTLGTMSATNWGLLSLAGGTMTGVLAAKNAATVGTPDICLGSDTDTGIYSAGANLLGLVANATELLRADGVLGYIKLLGTAALQLVTGTTAQRPASPVAGMLRYNSDLTQFEGYKGGVWGQIGGGGGGGGLTWISIGGTAPIDSDEEYGGIPWQFGPGLAQEIYSEIVVPQSYSTGSPISLYVPSYSPSSSGTQLMKAIATLITPGTTAVDSTTNQRTTTNSALTNTVAKQARTHTLDITDSTGKINSVSVAAGDMIKVKLYRDAADTDTANVRVSKNGFDTKFS